MTNRTSSASDTERRGHANLVGLGEAPLDCEGVNRLSAAGGDQPWCRRRGGRGLGGVPILEVHPLELQSCNG